MRILDELNPLNLISILISSNTLYHPLHSHRWAVRTQCCHLRPWMMTSLGQEWPIV